MRKLFLHLFRPPFGKMEMTEQQSNISKFIIFLILTLIPFSGFSQWTQLGQTLEGERASLWKGYSMALSADGSVAAIGAASTTGTSVATNESMSYVAIYKYSSSGEWEQLGEKIWGGVHFLSNLTPPRNGQDVALSADGNIVVMAERNYYYVNPDNESEILSNERTRIFEFVEGNWQQVGEDIYGNARAVSVSADGSIVAIGSDYDGTNGTQSGMVRVYRNVNNEWVQLGDTFYGTIANENLGSSIDLSGEGSVLAIGAQRGAGGGLTPNPGYVKIYNLQEDEWVLSGTIIGLESNDGWGRGGYFGSSVSLSDDGSIVAVGSAQYRNSANAHVGNVQVFQNVSGEWQQIGDLLEGARSGHENTKSMVDLSSNGTVLAFGTRNSASQGNVKVYKYIENQWELVDETIASEPTGENEFGGVARLSSDGSVLGIGIFGAIVNGNANAGKAKVYQNCTISAITAGVEAPEAFCPGGTLILTASITPEYYALAGTVNWYDSAEAAEPVFTGTEYETPELFVTTSYWVEAVSPTGCVSERREVVITVNPAPEFTLPANTEVCENQSLTLNIITAESNTVRWYDSADAAEPVFTGNDFETPELTENTTYWVEVESESGCISERVEFIITVLPAPVLNIETTEFAVCSGSEAELFATSAGNVIFWYANENDEEYLYHGNLFITDELTETTTYWVEAYNISTGCASERTEVTVTVNPVPEAPTAVTVQTFTAGQTLADLLVEAEGDLTWYADEALTVELPETTPLVDNTTYYVTQTNGDCESEAIGILVQLQLGISGVNGQDFTVYPNPTVGIVKIQSGTAVANIEVFNINGQKVTLVKGVSEVNISGYPSGTYVLRITLENGEVVTKKVIKK